MRSTERPVVAVRSAGDRAGLQSTTGSVPIDQTYVAWAIAVAPQLRGWSTYTDTMQQQAVITASALFSQALALEPPADTPVYVWIGPGVFTMGSTDAQCENAGFGACPKNELPRTRGCAGRLLDAADGGDKRTVRPLRQAEVCKFAANRVLATCPARPGCR